ncbi:MAG TPA: bifunctional hydroxymethylpyrimidine kinase/phosphomethylpyrimidine kinase [Gemmatimonadales bacterium]|jgi:hydroxymethylpyrimidine/phosphomethylpyrimidine kinase|nr:bifunctional hydroxymethylpyrimidine kinase/phosphomethylpyrimidine kinase [Gemmatimonadales bacterium]
MLIALTIAGSDSGGGAGIQADLKTFQRFGVFGTSVLTAITAQNTRGVHAVHPVPPAMVAAQFAAVVKDLPPAALKTGMLATAAVVREVARAIAHYELGNYVLDPVLLASSGERLLDPEGERELRSRLLPLATVVTPNLPEAAALAGFAVDSPGTMEQSGRALLEAGAAAVLVTGGHLPGEALLDVLMTPGGVQRFPHRRIRTSATHGTGCTLSAALTAGLALGRPLAEAVGDAVAYVQRAIAAAPGLGKGRGPLDHSA